MSPGLIVLLGCTPAAPVPAVPVPAIPVEPVATPVASAASPAAFEVVRPVDGAEWVRYGDQVLFQGEDHQGVGRLMTVDLDRDGVAGPVVEARNGGIHAWEVRDGRAVESDRAPVLGMAREQRPGLLHSGQDWYAWRGAGMVRVEAPTDPATAPHDAVLAASEDGHCLLLALDARSPWEPRHAAMVCLGEAARELPGAPRSACLAAADAFEQALAAHARGDSPAGAFGRTALDRDACGTRPAEVVRTHGWAPGDTAALVSVAAGTLEVGLEGHASGRFELRPSFPKVRAVASGDLVAVLGTDDVAEEIVGVFGGSRPEVERLWTP